MSIRRHLECDSSCGRRCHHRARVSSYFVKISVFRRAFAIGVLIQGVCFGLSAPTSAQTVEESRVKAAYLYNFAKFVDWPSGTFRNPNDPAVISWSAMSAPVTCWNRRSLGNGPTGDRWKPGRPIPQKNSKPARSCSLGLRIRSASRTYLTDCNDRVFLRLAKTINSFRLEE